MSRWEPSSDAIGTAVVAGVHAITDGMKQVLADRFGLDLAHATRTHASISLDYHSGREKGESSLLPY